MWIVYFLRIMVMNLWWHWKDKKVFIKDFPLLINLFILIFWSGFTASRHEFYLKLFVLGFESIKFFSAYLNRLFKYYAIFVFILVHFVIFMHILGYKFTIWLLSWVVDRSLIMENTEWMEHILSYHVQHLVDTNVFLY